jgi:hypothetical protein
LTPECLSCPGKVLILPGKEGRGGVALSGRALSFLGFDGQYWMLIVLAIVTGFVVLGLGAGRRR